MADGGRWRRVRARFEALQDLPAPERDAALEQLATDEPDIADEVAEFVRASEASAGLSRVLAESLAEEPATADELAGRSLGPFQLVRQLGSGGMGVVFEAVQDAPRRRVAVKVMRHGLISEHARKRFEVEGEILGRLKHPNVAQVFATGTYHVEGAGGDRTVPWIAMELIEGATPLDEHARAAGLSLEERLALFRALADAVQHAHARGIVHRDLKPQNALVDQEGVLKVIDFGIARMVGGDERSQLTHEGAVIGTVRYMAPEQLRGEEVDTRCDVYALGIVLHELLTGRPAHDLDDKPVPAAFRLLTEATPPAPSTMVPGLPRELDWVVRRALEPSAFDRYASAAELADDVGRFLRREPVRAHPASAAYLVRKYAARHRVGAALSGLAALFAIVALAIYLAGSASIRREHTRMVRLADARKLDELRAESEALHPAHPNKIPAMRAWLARAEQLAQRLDRHLADLAVIEARSSRPADDADGGLVFDDVEDEWWHDAVSEVVQGIRELRADDGGIPWMKERIERASTVVEETVTGERAAELWREAAASIADTAESPRYEGLSLEPQLGLLPLGPDPSSGLWEFLVASSGSEPARGPDGSLIPDEGSGIVLVLIPGGEQVRRGIDWDALAATGEIQELVGQSFPVDPFFLGKWEVTQAQWLRLGGEPASRFRGALHPVETVSWFDAARALQRHGLVLPKADAWKHAMRCENRGGWWFDEFPPDAAERFAIELDRTLAVGSREPNPNGLHDMLANVEEWLSNVIGERQRATTWGAYNAKADQLALYGSAAWEHSGDPAEAYEYRGLRAARELDSFGDVLAAARSGVELSSGR